MKLTAESHISSTDLLLSLKCVGVQSINIIKHQVVVQGTVGTVSTHIKQSGLPTIPGLSNFTLQQQDSYYSKGQQHAALLLPCCGSTAELDS